jgi:hypothetical protein
MSMAIFNLWINCKKISLKKEDILRWILLSHGISPMYKARVGMKSWLGRKEKIGRSESNR